MANNSMSNPLTPLQWLNIKLPQAKQTNKKNPLNSPKAFVFVTRFELEGKCSCILSWVELSLPWRCSLGEVSAQGWLYRSVCFGVSLARLASGWVMSTLCIKLLHHPYRSSSVRLSVPLLHLTWVSSSPRRQNCTSLLSLQRNNLCLPLLGCHNPSSLSSFSFTSFTRETPGTCRMPVAWNLPFATYLLSTTLIVPTNFKKQKEILKSSQLTKQGTQFTFAEPPCQNKARKSCALLGGLNHSTTQLYQRQGRSSSFPHGSLEPSFPGECCTSLHRHARASSTQTNLPLQGPTALLLNAKLGFPPLLCPGFALLEVNGVSRTCWGGNQGVF